jgi:hypothetical protein
MGNGRERRTEKQMKRRYNRIKAVAGLAAIALTFPAAADEKLAGRAARSVHLHYNAPACEAFYNRVRVDESQPGTYFCVCGFRQGYFGLQELADGRKVVIFSVWDPGHQDDPNAVPADQRVQLVHQGKGVRIGRFGGEGTGGQSFFDFDWKVGETYHFIVTARVEGHQTTFAGWVYVKDEWQHLVSFRTLSGGRRLEGLYSFIEDFRRNIKSAEVSRRAAFGSLWIKTDVQESARWTLVANATFTADSNPSLAIDAGVKDNAFFLQTGGGTTLHTPLKSALKLDLSSPMPPDVLASFPAAQP